MKITQKEIRQNHYPIPGMIIVSILGILGLVVLYLTKCFEIVDYNTFYQVIEKNGMPVIMSLFFIFICLYCWINLIIDVFGTPKKEVMYLQESSKYTSTFLNKKGKKYDFINVDKEVGKCYYVTKTKNYILEVQDVSSEQFQVKEKKSYWLNYYSPVGNFEDLLLLPIVYVILLPGILAIIMAPGYSKLIGVFYSLVPGFAIIYDLVYKIKLKNSDGKEVDDTLMIKVSEVLYNTVIFIFLGIFLVILLSLLFRAKDFTTRIIILPFVLCGIYTVGLVYAKVVGNSRLENICMKSYVITFLLLWFGMLGFISYQMISSGEYSSLIFTIPFIAVGAYIFYKYIIKG